MRVSVASYLVPSALCALALVQCTSVGTFSNFDPSVSGLTASPNMVLADGKMQSTLTLRIFYSPDVPATAVPVQFSASTPNATIVPAGGQSDANGTFVATFITTHKGIITVSTAVGGQGVDATLSTTITTAAPAVRLALTAGPALEADTPAVATVTLLDDANIVVTGYRGTVGLSSSDADGTLPANHTFVAGDAGRYIFPGLQMHTLGAQTLIAADVGNPNLHDQVTLQVTRHREVRITVPPPVVAGVPQTLQVAVTDLLGNSVANYAGTLDFTCSDTNALYPSTVALTAANAGAITLQQNLIFRTAGMQTLSAVDAAVADILGSNPNILVLPAPATRLVVTGLSSGPAGVHQTLVVTALDRFGNVATGYRGRVRFASSDPQAALPPNTLFTAAAAGVYSYPLVALQTVGVQSVTATDLDAPLITGNATGLVVTNAPAAGLLLTTAGEAVAGVPSGVVVSMYDPYHNLAKDFTGLVTFTTTDPQAQFTSSHTFTPADAGSFSFSVTYQTAGVQTITVQGPNDVGLAQQATVVSSAAMQALLLGGIVDGPAGMARMAAVRAIDNFNNTVTAYRGVVHFSSSDAHAQLPSDYGFAAADAGTKSFGLVLTTVGEQNVVVADTSNPNWSGVQNDILVLSGASTLQVLCPNNVVAGVPFSVTITAADAYSNLDPNYTGTVHFAAADAQATMPADVTVSPSDNGSVTVSGFILRTATTNQTITASDIVVPSRDGLHTGIVVSPAAASVLHLAAPTTATAGAQLTVTAGAYDIYNNLVPTYAGTVHFVSSDYLATLPSDATFGISDAGSRTYLHAVTLRADGNQTISVSDGNLTSAQVTVAVVDAGVSSLVLSTASQTVAGAPLDVTVIAEDPYGNVAQGYRGTVVITGQDTNGTYGAPLTFGPADDGNKFAPQQVTLTTAGAQPLTATDANNLSIVASHAQVTVLPAPGTLFALSAPATAQASMPFVATIAVYDIYHNIATDYGGVALLQSDDPQGSPSNTLPLSVHFAAGLTGRYDVSGVTLRTAGTRTLTVQDANNSAAPTPGTAQVTIAPTAITGFGLSAPASVVAGAPFAITVNALDSAGNIATAYTGAITWASGDGHATLPGSTPLGSGNQGNVTVSGLVLQMATAAQTVQVVDGNGIAGSIQIAVTAASPATLQLTGPNTAVAGMPLSVTVAAWDIYNNTVTTYTNTVHFVATGGGTAPAATLFTAADAGRRTFANGVTFSGDGNQTVTVFDGSLTPAALTVQVRNGAPSGLTLSTASSAIAGAPLSITVTAQDAYGNTALNFNDTVVISGQDPNGLFGAPIVFSSADLGSKTLPGYITLKASGLQLVTATDVNNNSVGFSNAVVTVSPASIAYLDMNAPATVAANSPISVAITGYDAYNNVANTYGGTTSLLSDDTLGSPSNTTPLTAHFSSGSPALRTITGVTLRSAGDHNLAVQDVNSIVTPVPDTVVVHVAPAGATHFGITLPASVAAGSAFSATIAALDASGNTDTAYTGTITWASSDPNATIPGSTVFAGGDQGSVAVSGLILQHASAGATLQVTDANGIAGSAQIVVTAASPATLQIGGPSTATAGMPLSVIVTAWDIYNNTVSTYANTVHFVATGGGTVPGDTPFTTADAGRRTFVNGVTLRTDGNQTVTVSDGSLTPATLSVQVHNGAASNLALSTATSTVAGTPLSITVTAQDAYGNTALNFNDTVLISGQDPNGLFGAPIVFASADLGTKTLPGYITLKASGSQLVTAADANSNTVGFSNAVVAVSPAAVAYLDMNRPTTVAASSPFSVTITGFDVYNNVANTYGGIASLSSDDPLGTPSSTSALTVHFVSGSMAVRTITGVTLRSAGDHNLTVQDANNLVTPAPETSLVHVVPSGATHFSISLPASVAAGAAFAATVAALDASGNTDTMYTGTITWASSDPNATLPGSTVFTGANQGNITVSGLTLQNASPGQTIQVVDANGLTGTTQLAVTSAAGHALQLSGSGNAIAGTPFTLNVVAKDIYNNTVASYANTVHFVTSDTAGSVPADTAFTVGDAGSHSFVNGATLRTDGNQTITITDGSLIGATLTVNVSYAPASVLVLTLPATSTAGSSLAVAVAAHDAFGNPVLNFNDTVVLSGQDPNGLFGAPIVFSSANQGTRTLAGYITLKASGSQLVVATDVNDTNVGVSNAIVSVAPQGIAYLRMNVPASVASASPFSVTITGYDTYNNVVTTYGGTDSLLSDDAQGTPSNTSPLLVHFASGGAAVRTVSGVTLDSAGNHNLTVQDVNNASSPTPYTSRVTVLPAGATHFGLTLPTSVVAGASFSATVTALDASGNTDPNYVGTVTLASADPNAGLPGGVGMVSANHGVVTISGLSLQLATPSQVMTVADTNGLAGQGTLIVQANTAVLLQLAGSGNAIAGTPTTVTVTARDTYANVATGYTGTVHFSSDGGSAQLPNDYTFGSSNAGTKAFGSGVTLRAAGAQNVIISDGTLAHQYLLVRVHSAAADALTMTLPASATAGVAFNVTLVAQDVYGNIVTDYNGTVVLSSQDSLGTYGSPFAFTPTQAGNTTLNNYVTLRTSGYFLVTATDANHASVSPASALMSVAAAGINRLDVQAPTTATSASPIVVTLTGYDNFNNITSAYNGNVTMLSTDVQGTPSTTVPLIFNFASGAQARRSISGVTLRTAGTTQLTAQDLATSAIIHGNANVAVSAAAASQLKLTLSPNVVAGTPVSPIVTAYDASGNQAPSYRGTVSFTSTDTAVTVPAAHAFSVGDAGQYMATNLLTFRTAGAQTLSVQDAAPGITADVESTTVKWASPNNLRLYIAAAQVAGSALSPNVVCLDAFGNSVQDYTGTVHFTSTDTGPSTVLPSNTSFVLGDTGHHIFTNGATLTIAANQNITVTDTSPGPIGATASTAITASVGVQLALQVPASVVAGVAFNVGVNPYDQYGNPNALFSGSLVTLAATDSQASITLPSYSFPVPSSGTLILSGAVTLRTAGTRTLTVKEVFNAADHASASITVVAAALSRFTFGPREIVTAGTSFNTSLAASDAYGNTVTSFTGTVSVSSTDASGTPASGTPWSESFVAANSGQITLTGVTFNTLEHQYLTATSGGTTGKGHYLVHHNMNFTSGQAYDYSLGEDTGSGSAPTATRYAGAMYGAYTTPQGVFYLPDTGDNRVLIFNSFPTSTSPTPNYVLGQNDFVSSTSATDASHFDWPVAVTGDGNGGLFITDYLNYRVLHYNTAPLANVPADGVLGQPNFASTGCSCTRLGMCEQAALQVVENQNALLVADRYQNRVLIYRPIPITNGVTYASMVLGQPDFTTCGPSSAGNGLSQPMAVWSDGVRLAVADQANHRVLLWNTFSTVLAAGVNGVSADYVIGQTNLNNNTDPGTSPSAFVTRYPNALEGDGTHLFVVDAEYTRVAIYNTIPTSNNVGADGVLMQADLNSTGCNGAYCGGDGLYLHGTHLMVGMSNVGGDYVFTSP